MAGGVGAYEPPKYAQFETGPTGHALEPKKVNDDALPPMPSWDTAQKKHVLAEDASGAVEMGDLDPKTGQEVPLMSGAGAISRTASPAVSPVASPYGDAHGMNGQHGYGGAMGPGGMGPAGMGPNGMGMGPGGMGPGAMGAGALGAGALGAGAMAMGGRGNGMDPYNRNGPGGFNTPPNNRSPYGPPGQNMSPLDSPSRGGFNQYPPGGPGGPGNFGGPGVAAAGAYGRQPQRQQYPGDQPGGRGFAPPQRQFTPDGNRPMLAPSPQRPYPDATPLSFPEPSSYTNLGRMASPPNNMNNTSGGFDFGDSAPSRGPPQSMPVPYGGGGMARRPVGQPQHDDGQYGGSTAPPSYASRSPPPMNNDGGGGRGGYQPYNRAPPSSEGRRREPQGWEGV